MEYSYLQSYLLKPNVNLIFVQVNKFNPKLLTLIKLLMTNNITLDKS